MDHSDSELLKRYAEERSDEAFVEIARRHLTLIYRTALRHARGNAALADDASQTVLVQLARKAGPLARHPRLVGWLYTTTHHVTSTLIRSERRRQAREQDAIAMENMNRDSNENDGWDKISPIVDEILRDLGETDRDAVLLHFFEARTFAEVGASLDMGEDAARMRVTRALEKMRRALSRRGIQSTSAALALMLGSESAMAAPAHLMASAAVIATNSSGIAVQTSGLIHLMNTSKVAAVLAAGIGILGTGAGAYYAIQLEREAARDRIAIATADTELAVVRSRLAEATNQLAVDKAALVSTSNKRASQRTAVRTAQGSTAQVGADPAQEMKALVASPSFEHAFIANTQTMLTTLYGPLYQQLGLSADQQRIFGEAMMRRCQANFDVGASALDQDLSISDPGIAKLFAKNEADFYAEVSGFATPEQIQQFEQIQAPASRAASALRESLQHTDAPLTAQQSTSLIQLVAAHSGPGSGSVDWNSVMAGAPAILSPQQVSLLSAVQAKIQYNQAVAALTPAAGSASP
jgi:RNA polymerase sigma factor (sigma-70 family)